MRYGRSIVFGAAAMAFAAAPVLSAFTFPGCPDVTDADFKVTALISHAANAATSEPLKMAFDMDASGNTDVYFVQRFGLLRKYDAARKTVVDLAKFTVPTGSSDGLIGIALDPAFKANRWIYLYYSTNADWRVGRFTLNGEQLDMASEKVLITIAESAGSQHTGGAMQFDWEGNLWITVGDNNKGSPAANTNDLRGKILRIHPTADGKYTVPAGNLFPAGTDKTRPEIYIMGNRNPYSITLDPLRKAVTWGDVGPDFSGISEEHDFTTKPGFFGWPYYAGDNIKLGGGGTPAAPVNTDNGNTGLANLPPAIPALDSYKQSCALTGPVYYFDPALTAKGKFPQHFQGKWFVSDFSKGTAEVLTLDETGSKILSRAPIFTGIKITSPLDFQAGPDGNMYFVNYAGYRTTSDATGLLKIEYTGAPCAAGTFPPIPTALRPGPGAGDAGADLGFALNGMRLSIGAIGRHAYAIADLSGRTLAQGGGNGPAEYDLGRVGNAGVYLLTVTTEGGNFSRKFVRP